MPVFLVIAAAAIHQYMRHRQREENSEEVSNEGVERDEVEKNSCNESKEEDATYEGDDVMFHIVANCCASDAETTNDNDHDDVSKESSAEARTFSVGGVVVTKEEALRESENLDKVSAYTNRTRNPTVMTRKTETTEAAIDKECFEHEPLDDVKRGHQYQRLLTDDTAFSDEDQIETSQRKKDPWRHHLLFNRRWKILRMRFSQWGRERE